MMNRLLGMFLAFLTLTHFALAGGSTVKVLIDGMHCGGCVKSVRAKLEKLPNVAQVDVKIVDAAAEKGMAVVTLKDGSQPDGEAIKKAVSEAGYTVKSLQ